MCRNIKTLANFAPPATEDEIRASALQFVRKLSGTSKPSKANEEVFNTAVAEVTEAAEKLIRSLKVSSPPRDREEEARKAKERSIARFGAVVLMCGALMAGACAPATADLPPKGGSHTAPAVPRAPMPADPAMAQQVKQELLHAWNAYKQHAWGQDDLLPVSRKGRNWYGKETLYMTAVDSVSTLALMGFTDETRSTVDYIAKNSSWDKDISVSNFEITIRILGGLVSAYQTTGDQRLLTLADDLATRLMPVFKSKTGMPYRFVNLKTGKVDGVVSNPAEIGTLILEWGTLAKLTNKPEYFDVTKRALKALYEHRDKTTGLVGQGINVETGEWTAKNSHVGGAIDSYYEYLLKCERLFGDRECGDMYRDAIASVNKYIADETPNGLWYGRVDMTTGQRNGTNFGSLHAFMPGMLAMGGDIDRATRLQESAFKMWTLHGIEPESFNYVTQKAVGEGYQLRPEIMESAYILSHYTRDPKYLEMGRTMFADLVKHCRTESGYTVLRSVVTKEKGDLQHSFLLAETLKYLYLLSEPSALNFEDVVFNTEAHPLKRVR